jgi:hypothetical protein
VQAAFNSGAEVRGEPGTEYYCGTTTINVPGGARARLYGVKLSSDVDKIPFLHVQGGDVEILGAEIEGQGSASLTDPAEVLVRFGGASAAAYHTGLLLRDCWIHDSGFYGFYCEFAADVVIDRCRFNSIRHIAVVCQSTTHARVNDNVIHDIGPGSAGTSYGLTFDRRSALGDLTRYPRSKDCEAIGNLVYDIPEWEALDTHAGENIVFANNVIRDCRYGINVSPDTADRYPPLNITITGNTIDSGSLSSDPRRAIGSGGASNNKASNILVRGNVVKGYGANTNEDGAIMFQHTDGLVIADNVIENSRAGAICLFLDNDRFALTGNVIRGVRKGVANAAGVNIRNTAQTGHIAGNFIETTAEIGVFIAARNPGVTFGPNRIVTSGSRYVDARNGGAGLELTGSTTTDVASIADGDQAQFAIAVTGAAIGDECSVVANISTQALSLTGQVAATNTVTAILQNNTGRAVDLPIATYTAIVRKR